MSEAKKSRTFVFRMTEAEYERLQHRAEVNRLSIAALLRRWIENPPQSIITIMNGTPSIYVGRTTDLGVLDGDR